MKKIKTYLKYLSEYLKYGDFRSVIAAIRFVISRKSHRNDRIIKTSLGKFFCRKNTNDFQFANFYYEWAVKKYILDHIRDYDIFIDAGACIGDYSVLLSSHGIKCFAFEPVANNFDVLLKNLELNQLQDKVSAYPFGLGNNNYSSPFIFDPVNTGASHISGVNNLQGILSEIRTLDSVPGVDKIAPPERILFKMDVEGMECDVIEGAVEFIISHSSVSFIIETKHSGKEKIIQMLNNYAVFDYGNIDDYNFYAVKIKNLT